MNRTILLFALKLIISAALITFLISKMEMGLIVERLSDLDWAQVSLTILIFQILLANNTLRWMIVLSAIDRPYDFGLIFKIQYMGGFFNQTLPSTIGGDAVRVYVIHKSGTTINTAVNSIILERVLTVVGLVFLVTLVQPFIDLPIDKTSTKYIFPGLSLLMIMGVIVLTQLDKFPQSLLKWKIFRGIAKLAEDARSLFLSPLNLLKSVAFGISGNVFICLFMYQCAQSLGVDLSVTEALVLVPPAILISTLPISIAGWGVRESAMVTSLSLAGIAEVDAFSISILFGLLMAAISVPGGVIWLLHRNNK